MRYIYTGGENGGNTDGVIEYLHDSGKLPDKYYYQIVNDPMGAYIQQRDKWTQDLLEKRREAELSKQMEKEIEKQVYDAVEKALDDLLKGFEK